MSDVRSILLAKRPRVTLEGALSTGSTLLNLACTDHPRAGYLPGGYYFLVGDSTSGKTWLAMSALAEAAANPKFDKYRLIYDDVEGGALMDLEKYFGQKLVKRLEPPKVSAKGRAVHSTTVESFYYHVQDAIDARKPFVYVLDSQDALESLASQDKFKEQKKAYEEGKEAAGSYGDGKAKKHSEQLRHVVSGLRRSGSILLIIGQTRDNLGMGFEKKTRSGGKALKFYANLEIWTSFPALDAKIKKRINGKERTIGVNCFMEVRKNRVTGKTGKDRAVTIPIYHGLGIDEVGSCVDYLIDEGHWEKISKTEFDAKEVMCKGTREKIIKSIEEDDLESKVAETVAKVWAEVEAQCVPQRKARYS